MPYQVTKSEVIFQFFGFIVARVSTGPFIGGNSAMQVNGRVSRNIKLHETPNFETKAAI
jgi:hypothetical protein